MACAKCGKVHAATKGFTPMELRAAISKAKAPKLATSQAVAPAAGQQYIWMPVQDANLPSDVRAKFKQLSLTPPSGTSSVPPFVMTSSRDGSRYAFQWAYNPAKKTWTYGASMWTVSPFA